MTNRAYALILLQHHVGPRLCRQITPASPPRCRCLACCACWSRTQPWCAGLTTASEPPRESLPPEGLPPTLSAPTHLSSWARRPADLPVLCTTAHLPSCLPVSLRVCLPVCLFTRSSPVACTLGGMFGDSSSATAVTPPPPARARVGVTQAARLAVLESVSVCRQPDADRGTLRPTGCPPRGPGIGLAHLPGRPGLPVCRHR